MPLRWFVPTPTLLARAVAGAALFAVIAPPYSKRTSANDTLPATSGVGQPVGVLIGAVAVILLTIAGS